MIPPVVPAEWLAAHADEVVVCDVRWYLDGRSGRAAYDGGHLPGAVFVDLDTALADPPSARAGRHPLLPPGRFAVALSELGIGDGDVVVAYDDAGGSVAARLVWMLRAIGDGAALLDGGLAAWPGPLETNPAVRRAAIRTARPWPDDLLADADAVAVAAADPEEAVVDARAAERYRGEVEPVDARAGHVPGARSLPWAGNLDGDGRFLAPARLRERYADAGITDAARAVVYCGSGVTACQPLLAMELAGLGRGRLYAGSWSQWAADPTKPCATGPEPEGETGNG